MATPIFLYPSLTDALKNQIFQAKKYTFSYTTTDDVEKDLAYEVSTISDSTYLLKTDGVWDVDKHNLIIRRPIALRHFRSLFGPDGLACSNARLGLALMWSSADSKQRGAVPIVEFGISRELLAAVHDETFVSGDIDWEFASATIRGDVTLSVVLYIAKAGTPSLDELHLANEEGFVLGVFDSIVIRLEGTGSLFPVYDVYEPQQPLWYVRCDWTDPTIDRFTDSVSININTAHKNYKFIDRTQKTFCAQLLVEVMSSALCCIIEKIRSEQYLTQVLGDEEMESGSVGEVVRYFANTLGWDFSTPDNLSLSTRHFFDGRLED